MPSKQIIQDAKEIVADLRTWADEFGHTEDPYVASLADSLEKGINLSYWAEVDPLEYLPTTDTVTIIPALRFARLLAAIRNVVIFIPVALTWAAVSEATKGFNAFAQTNTGTPANFLLFWQNGYGYLDDFWKIGNIAQIDFLIVAIVIAFSAMVSIFQARGLKLAAQLQARFSRHRRLLGLQVRSYLFSYRDFSAVEVPADLASSVNLLRQAVTESLENLQTLQKTAASLNDYVPALAGLGEKLIEVANITDHSVAQLVNGTADSVSKVLGETTTSISKVLESTGDSFNTVLDELEATSVSIKSSTRGLQDQLESLQRTVARKK